MISSKVDFIITFKRSSFKLVYKNSMEIISIDLYVWKISVLLSWLMMYTQHF